MIDEESCMMFLQYEKYIPTANDKQKHWTDDQKLML